MPPRRARRYSTGWLARSEEPVVLCSQTANVRSMRLAAKLGFRECAALAANRLTAVLKYR